MSEYLRVARSRADDPERAKFVEGEQERRGLSKKPKWPPVRKGLAPRRRKGVSSEAEPAAAETVTGS